MGRRSVERGYRVVHFPPAVIVAGQLFVRKSTQNTKYYETHYWAVLRRGAWAEVSLELSHCRDWRSGRKYLRLWTSYHGTVRYEFIDDDWMGSTSPNAYYERML